MSAYETTKSFKARLLKLKLRLGVLGIGCNMKRQNRSDGKCPKCGEFESVKHFILMCPAYNAQRLAMFTKLKNTVPSETFNFLLCENDFTIAALLGSHDDIFNECFMPFLFQIWRERSFT